MRPDTEEDQSKNLQKHEGQSVKPEILPNFCFILNPIDVPLKFIPWIVLFSVSKLTPARCEYIRKNNNSFIEEPGGRYSVQFFLAYFWFALLVTWDKGTIPN